MDKIKIKPSSLISMIVGGGVLVYGLTHSIFKVEPGFNAIKFNKLTGLRTNVLKEGFHLMVPYFEFPIIYDCKLASKTFDVHCGTKDLQMINLKIRIVTRPYMDKLPELYRLLGLNYNERVLLSIVYEIAGGVVSGYNASQLITQRDTISMIIKNRVQEKGKNFFIEMADVALIDIKFSKEVSEAIEKKQVAQQEAERMKFLVEEALEDKKSTIIKAQGEAESVKKFGLANEASTAFLELRKIETAKKISKLLEKSNNRVILDSNSLYLNLPAVEREEKKM